MEELLQASEVELLQLLRVKANEAGYVQVSQRKLAQELGVRQPNVSAMIRTLKLVGLVEVKILMDQGRPNLMHVN
jgi:Mn-dependent DtxR family transcriptional regulator